jgi:hypothetical protein
MTIPQSSGALFSSFVGAPTTGGLLPPAAFLHFRAQGAVLIE